MSEIRKYIPNVSGELTESEVSALGGQIEKFDFHQTDTTPSGAKRAGKKAILAAAGLMVASEGQALAQRVTGYDIGRVIDATGQIYRTKKQAEAHKRDTEARERADKRRIEAGQQQQEQRHEEEMSKIDARKQQAAMEGAIAGGGEMEVEVSEDGKAVKATTSPEKLKFVNEVKANQRELVKIHNALKLYGGDFTKMWQVIDKAGKVSKADRAEVEEKWEQIENTLKQQGAIK